MYRAFITSARIAALVAFAVTLAVASRSTCEEPDENNEEVSEAIRKLGDPSFQVRQQAQRALLEIGTASEKLLKQAANSADLEVAKRAKAILEEFEKRRLFARADKLTFDELIGRVRQAEDSKEWQKPGWNDPVIEAGLSALVARVNLATKQGGVRLPVTLADVQPRKDAAPGNADGGLFVMENGTIGHAQRSIFLADGNVRIGFANDCVVLARGAVEIAHGGGNVVLAGHYVHTSHDGSRQPSRSLLVSGSILDVSHSNGTICSAPGVVSIGFATGTTFLNSPRLDVSHEKGCEKLNNVKLPIVPAAGKNRLSDRIKITQIVRGNDSGQGAMVVLDQDGVELVIRVGREITDQHGKRVPDLAGWKLTFVAENFALFSRAGEDASFYLKKRQ